MSRDEVARAVDRIESWVRLYSRDLPLELARDRREEVLADVHDHVAWGRAHEVPERRVARALLGRAVRGAPADLSWAMSVGSPGRALDRALGAILAALTFSLIAMGGIGLARRPPEGLGGESLAVILGIALGVGALALLVRRRTRWLAALWVVASAQVILFDGLDYLAGSTTILRHVASTAPDWEVGLLVAVLGVVLVCVAAAVWWTRPVSERREWRE